MDIKDMIEERKKILRSENETERERKDEWANFISEIAEECAYTGAEITSVNLSSNVRLNMDLMYNLTVKMLYKGRTTTIFSVRFRSDTDPGAMHFLFFDKPQKFLFEKIDKEIRKDIKYMIADFIARKDIEDETENRSRIS